MDSAWKSPVGMMRVMKKRSDTVVLAGMMRSTLTAVQLTMLVPTRPIAHTLAG
jgi:hypothetical protein